MIQVIKSEKEITEGDQWQKERKEKKVLIEQIRRKTLTERQDDSSNEKMNENIDGESDRKKEKKVQID